DVAYLLGAGNQAFPSARLVPDDVIASWAGLRPLIKVDTAHASDVPREHKIFRDGKMITIAGGKLTTYRRMAAEVVDAAVDVTGLRVGGSSTGSALLPGARDLEDHDFDKLAAGLAQESGLPLDVAQRLANVYGSKCRRVLAYAKDDPAMRERVCPDRDVIMAE